MSFIGTTYYWLDDRQEVYQLGWILASALWLVTIGFSILFVKNKTRLGYLVAGILSWVTLAFWLLDNYYIVFQDSIIARQPNFEMTVRNFVGVIVAYTSILASHNVFHKIHSYQYRGVPV